MTLGIWNTRRRHGALAHPIREHNLQIACFLLCNQCNVTRRWLFAKTPRNTNEESWIRLEVTILPFLIFWPRFSLKCLLQANLLFQRNKLVFNSKIDSKILFGLIQFNEIFIQLEDQGIGHHYGKKTWGAHVEHNWQLGDTWVRPPLCLRNHLRRLGWRGLYQRSLLCVS